MQFPVNKERKLAAALLLLAVVALVANQAVKRPAAATAAAAVAGASPAAAPAILKKDLKWNSAESRFELGGQAFTGAVEDRHPNGQPRLKWSLREGKWHGLVEEYNDKGVKVTSKLYENGLRHGETRYYYPEGQLMKIVQYNQDTEGAEQLFNRDGSPMAKHP